MPGFSTATSFVTKLGCYCPSRGRAWGQQGEHACPSAAEPEAATWRRELAPTQPPSGSIRAPQPGSSPRLPLRSGDRIVPPHGHPRPGRLGSSSAPGPVRLPRRPEVSMQVGDPVNPLPRFPVSPSPELPKHGPNAATAGVGSRDSELPPRQSPSTGQCPNRPRCRAEPYIPGEATRSPGGPWYCPVGQSAPWSPIPLELPAYVDTFLHPRGSRQRFPDPPRSAPAFPRPNLIP